MWQAVVQHFCFFSSRRRHTRLLGDWSSDVCSSDLVDLPDTARSRILHHRWFQLQPLWQPGRSEERRVGKEWRCGGWHEPEEKIKEEEERSGVWCINDEHDQWRQGVGNFVSVADCRY